MVRCPHRMLPGESGGAYGITTDSSDSTSFGIGSKAEWQFTKNYARIKLKRLYPQFE